MVLTSHEPHMHETGLVYFALLYGKSMNTEEDHWWNYSPLRGEESRKNMATIAVGASLLVILAPPKAVYFLLRQ